MTGHSWMAQGACVRHPNGDDLFFPSNEGERAIKLVEATRQAKAICATCAVQETCLTYAFEHDIEHGVWGGLSATEREGARRRWLAERARAA